MVCSLACKKSADNHAWVICSKKVHAITPCSSAAGEEEYGQKRVCSICEEKSESKEVHALNEFDNWKNLGVTDQTFLLSRKLNVPAIEGKEKKRPK